MTSPRAVVEAELRSRCGCSGCANRDGRTGHIGHHGSCWADMMLGIITPTVLAAHYAGEVEGGYKVKRSPSGLEYHVYPSGMSVGWEFRGTTRSEAEARRVAHALNWEPIP